jgi:hypothetical protein
MAYLGIVFSFMNSSKPRVLAFNRRMAGRDAKRTRSYLTVPSERVPLATNEKVSLCIYVFSRIPAAFKYIAACHVHVGGE